MNQLISFFVLPLQNLREIRKPFVNQVTNASICLFVFLFIIIAHLGSYVLFLNYMSGHEYQNGSLLVFVTMYIVSFRFQNHQRCHLTDCINRTNNSLSR